MWLGRPLTFFVPFDIQFGTALAFFYSICKKVNVLRWKEAANVLVLKSFVAKNFNYHSNVEIHVPGVHIKK